MKQFYFLIFAIASVLATDYAVAQTIWAGPTVTFTKQNNADWTLETNQDRITDAVWITRANNQGIFNIFSEPNYTDFSSPADTEWAFGTTADIGSLTFVNWEDLSMSSPPSLVGSDLVLHLISENIYINIKFTSWQSGGAGGGFSYERSTNQTLSTTNNELEFDCKLYPNPSKDFIMISGLSEAKTYIIYNALGVKIQEGIISKNEKIDIKEINNGLYFLKLEGGSTLKFLKE